jgi:hypothetical protein
MKSEKKVHQKLAMAAMVMGALLTAGCAGNSTIPAEKIAGAEKSIDTAKGTTAATTAPAELKSAEEKLAEAKAAVEKKEFDKASRLADAAAADAELAQAKASSAKSKKAADQMRDTVRSLRRELDQMQPK